MIIESVVTQHAEDAAFLWLLRDAAVAAPHYSLKDLADLDDRVEAHIDGLRVAGDDGWKLCADALVHEESGEVFAAGVLAVESKEPGRFRKVCEVVRAAPECADGLVSALAWARCSATGDMIRGLIASSSSVVRAVGRGAAAVRRERDDPSLETALQDEDPRVRARSIRAVGELKRDDLVGNVEELLVHEDAALRFWAAWACSLMQRSSGHKPLRVFAESDSPHCGRALEMYLRVKTPKAGLSWLKTLHKRPERARRVIQGAGVLGDPGLVPWLLKQMSIPELARVAGEAFTMITGVDLAYEDLEGDWPEGFAAGPSESPEDEAVEMDPDEDLPWPEPSLVTDWWKRNEKQFLPGMRYLLGKPIDEGQLQWVLRHGMQRQRRAAALELALRNPAEPLFEIRAPGFSQMRSLGLQ